MRILSTMVSVFTTLAIGILPSVSSSVGLQVKRAGDDDGGYVRLTPRTIEHNDKRDRVIRLQNETPNQNYEIWTPPSRNRNVSQVERYEVRDFETCIPGQESVRFCRSNPDQPTCDDGSYPITRQLVNSDGAVVRQNQFCPGDPPNFDIDDEQMAEVITVDIERFRSFPIRGSSISSAPNKFSLRNGHTHFWASEEHQTFTSNLSGANVRIKAIPIQWNWKYGDGTTRNLNFAGEAMPNHTLHEETTTSHSYKETGTFQVGATTLYRGEFSVDGGPWQAIPGQAAVPSDPIEIDVWRTKKELIANE